MASIDLGQQHDVYIRPNYFQYKKTLKDKNQQFKQYIFRKSTLLKHHFNLWCVWPGSTKYKFYSKGANEYEYKLRAQKVGQR